MKPVALIIRDGGGISPKGAAAAKQEGNAPLLAKLPFHEYLYKTYPQSRLSASGEDVGLPAGQMGRPRTLSTRSSGTPRRRDCKESVSSKVTKSSSPASACWTRSDQYRPVNNSRGRAA